MIRDSYIMRVAFDPETGLIKSISGMRYRGREESKTPYRGEYGGGRYSTG